MSRTASSGLSRRGLLALLGAGTVSTVLVPAVHASPLKSGPSGQGPASSDLGRDLLAEWAASPGTHPLLGDFRHAGYRQGAKTPNPRVATNVKHHSAVADGVTDDAPAFNAAVRAVGEQGGGTVLVPPGTYHLASPIWMHWSNVVLRGANTKNTILHFSRPLKDGYRENWQESKSQGRWSWAGGQIWVIPEEVKAKLEDEEWLGTEGWKPGETVATVSPAPRGTTDVTVSSTAGLSNGQMVLLETENPADASLLKHLAGDTEGARAYDWEASAPQLVRGTEGFYPQYESLQWPVRIEKVLDDTTVRLTQPVKHDLDERWPSVIRELGVAGHDVVATGVGMKERVSDRHDGWC